MSESVVADFVGRFHTDDIEGNEPVRGRVLLSRKRLVLAYDGGKTTVPLSSVFDVTVGFVPNELNAFFHDTVTVAFDEQGQKRAAVIEGKGETIDRFAHILFRVLLNETTVTVTHPASVGGRVTGADPQQARLSVKKGAVQLSGQIDSFTIDLSAVTDIQRTTRNVDGSQQPVLEISHVDDGSTLVSIVAVPSGRKTNIFGRFVRLEYSDIREEIRELSHTEEEVEILVTLYSTGGSESLASLLDIDPTQMTMLLNSLREDGLITDTGNVTTLTPKGRVAATMHIERVNA